MSDKNAKPGMLPRGFRLGKLGLSLVGSYLGYQAQNLLLGKEERPQRSARFQQKASRRVREELGEMKGAAMKLGQIMSMGGDVLPEEAVRELAQLQMQAPGMHPTLARAQFKSSLGKNPEEIFREFDAEPFAAASLGQVHRAITRKGERVAVKIQYPAIRSAIENDLKLLKSATLPGQLSGYIPRGMLDEIQRGLLEETDYAREADNLEFFRQGLSQLAYVEIPRVYREFSTDRVLTMSLIEGEKLGDFLKRSPSQAMRDLLGFRLWEMYETQLASLQALHADPHPGNYFFRPDGSIGMVDFGCVKRISFQRIEFLYAFNVRTWREDGAKAREFLAHLYGPGVPYARARKMVPFLEQIAEFYFPNGIPADIDYGDPKVQSEMKAIGAQYWKQVLADKLINPEWTFIMRAEFGGYHMMQELAARVNVGKIWLQIAAGRALTSGK